MRIVEDCRIGITCKTCFNGQIEYEAERGSFSIYHAWMGIFEECYSCEYGIIEYHTYFLKQRYAEIGNETHKED